MGVETIINTYIHTHRQTDIIDIGMPDCLAQSVEHAALDLGVHAGHTAYLKRKFDMGGHLGGSVS